ncbi:D-glycero-alpha-D-manno-heptose 1-phosphate guanylyltransferase [Neomoorella glycerini]|uniref:D-glycero-alpha-D-manno-heptose 1-phosphate guanylyltransferase n=1 Tax=Neomoorella glycerini TaxID=55779 RepID=A0A6I5ZT10_9FIRM|nr:nucleotidyltransferase family protein [Moorella glycerini]QGP92677.1 D-glycero-alpha-D-manno-heptose 1-phosphate guanylyltransferase [Moorella glycerini]
MQAVILAGGFGTRLRPVVPDLPKALAKIGSRPFLKYQLAWLASYGTREVILCLGYRSQAVLSYLSEVNTEGIQVISSIEQEPLGTAGALKHAEHLLAERFLVVNGDTFVDVNLTALVEYHYRKVSFLTMVLANVEDATAYGQVKINNEGRVVSFQEKVPGRGQVNAGVYFMEKSVLRYIPPDQPYSMERELLPKLLTRGELVYGFVHEGYFIDIGTPLNYRRAQEELPGRFM